MVRTAGGSGIVQLSGLQSRDSLLNIGSINASGEYPFINRMKNWAINPSTDSNATPYPLQINSDGFPVGALPANIGAQFDFPPSYSNDWILDWIGASGGDAFDQSMNLLIGSTTPTIVSGSSFVVSTGAGRLSVFGTNGSVRFNVGSDPTGTATFQFLTAGNFSGMTSVRVYRADQATALATSPFNPDFVTAIKNLKPRILRFLDWRVVNYGNATTYSRRALTSNISYNNGKWIAGDYVGNISGTNTYTCGNGTNHNPAAYVDKETVQGRFTNANTGASTLNRNGLGAVSILNNQAGGLPAFTGGEVSANQLATLVYDASLNVYMYATGGIAHSNGSEVAMEDIITLCNQCGCDMWINLSHLIDSASITSFMQLIAPLLSGKLYLEFSNEIWNAQFSQTAYATKKAAATGVMPSGTFYSWYGLQVAQMAVTAVSAWTALRARNDLKIVNAWQASDSSDLTFGPIYLYRLKGNELSSFGFNTSPNRPGDLADVFSWAPYVNGAVMQNADPNYANPLTTLYTAADNWNSGNVSASRSFFDNDLRVTLASNVSSIYPGWETVRTQTWAGSVKRTICYEGGVENLAPTVARLTALGDASPSVYGGNPSSPPNGRIQNAYEDYKLSSNFRRLVYDYYIQISASGAAGQVVPSWFDFDGQDSQWSMYQGDIYSPVYASYAGVQQYNSGG